MKTFHFPLALFLFAAVVAFAEDAPPPLKTQTKCPIMGGAINKALYADVQNQRIYVCCQGCVGAIKADPAKAFAGLQKNGEYAESLQKTCPVMGGPVNPKLSVDYEGRRLYACCAGCLAPLRKDPAKYAKRIAPDETPAK